MLSLSFNSIPTLPKDFRMDAFSFNEENQTWYFLELKYELKDKIHAGYFKNQTKTHRPVIHFNIVKTFESFNSGTGEQTPTPYKNGYKYHRKLKNNKFKFNKQIFTLNRGALTPD